MKFFIKVCCLLSLFYLQSCGDSMIKNKSNDDHQASSKISKSKVPVPVTTGNKIVRDEKDLTGYWVGEFGPQIIEADSAEYQGEDEEYNKINISIDEINGSGVKGHTVIAGKVHFFKCEMGKDGTTYKFSFNGAADEKSDGVYKFSITEGDSLLKGSWSAGEKIPAHSYSLTKKTFNYNSDCKINAERYVDYQKSKKVMEKSDDGETYENERYAATSGDIQKYNASSTVLTKDDVANLKKSDLLILRNAIYARHGYTFKKPLLNLFFSQQSWYIPVNTDVTAELTDTEKKNIQLMMRYEKNAREYYDAFGR